MTDLKQMIDEAKEMQEEGLYIRGRVFHTITDELDRLEAINAELVEALESILERSREELETVCAYDEGGYSSIDSISHRALAKAKGKSDE